MPILVHFLPGFEGANDKMRFLPSNHRNPFTGAPSLLLPSFLSVPLGGGKAGCSLGQHESQTLCASSLNSVYEAAKGLGSQHADTILSWSYHKILVG